MAKATFSQAGITAIHTVLGPVERSIEDDREAFGGNDAQLERIRKTIGLDKRRVVGDETTALDLGEQAVRCLGLESEPDALVMVTQTPDHFQPCNAALLHGRLGYGADCAALDVALGCSGWVYGLYLSYLMIEAGGCDRVLLVTGDTMSRCVHRQDRATAVLFGDAASATLVERRSEASPSRFVLHSRGSGAEHICVPAGGFRQRPSAETRVEVTDQDGNTRTAEHLHMNGAEVFNFTMLEVPSVVTETLEYAGVSSDSVDVFAFHQANRYILSNIARRLKIPIDKVPSGSVAKFGNLSSASIPGVLCDEWHSALLGGSQKLLACGFGVGLSWASALLDIGPLKHCGLSDYEPVR